MQKTLADALNKLPELEQAAITLALEQVVNLIDSEADAAQETAGDGGANEPASPILDVPIDGTPPESGLAV
jgi:hypothetical protein